MSQGWKNNPFGKFGCEPGYGTSRFSWATLRGWKPSVIEEPTVRQSTRADLWKATHGVGWIKLNELAEERRKAASLLQVMDTSKRLGARPRLESWWNLPMEDILESLDNKERKSQRGNWYSSRLLSEDMTDRERGIQHLQDAMTGPGYELEEEHTVDLVNYPFQKRYGGSWKNDYRCF